METNTQTKQADNLIFLGLILFLLGLIIGLFVQNMANPRMALSAHLEAVMNGGTELLSKGSSIVIFPQSTRNLVFKPEEFNSIGVKLAKKAGVPVVPVAIKTDFWGNGRLIKELGPIDNKKTIHIKFGEPFMVTGNGKEENNRIISFIQESLEEWNK